MERLVLLVVSLSLLVAGRAVLGSEEKKQPNNEVAAPAEVARIHDFMSKNCTDCHNQKKKKGDLQLDNFNTLNKVQLLEILGKVEKQVALNQMPPDDDPLPVSEKEALMGWIEKTYAAYGLKSGLKDELRQFKYGNYTNHEQLFSGVFKNLPGYTEDRQWLISEYIFNERMNALMGAIRTVKVGVESKELAGRGPPEKIANPFLLPTRTGVRYYANEELNSGQFQTLLSNSGIVAEAMIGTFALKNKEYLPAAQKITAMTVAHNTIIENRRTFMLTHIDRICSDIYKRTEESMLPVYTPVAMDKEVNEKAESFGKWGWRNRIGAADGTFITATLHKFKSSNSSKKDLIEKCARYWCHWGEDPATIDRRVAILAKELSSILNHGYFNANPAYVYKPLNNEEMQIIETTIKAKRTKGMPYKELIEKCVAQWREDFRQVREKNDVISDDLVADLVTQLYGKIHKRQPTPSERAEQTALMRSYMSKLGSDEAVRKLTQTLLLSTEFIFRNEYGEGKEDQFGRKMLSPNNAATAIAYALTDSAPDEQLLKAVNEGRLNTREDYRREVQRILKSKSHVYLIDTLVDTAELPAQTNTPIRKLRFFREFFGYPNMMSIFKDELRFDVAFGNSLQHLVAGADLLVDDILKKDKNVFEELLTTDKFYVAHNGDNVSMAKQSASVKKPYDYFKDKDWQNFKSYSDLLKHKDFVSLSEIPGVSDRSRRTEDQKNSLVNFKTFMNRVASKELDYNAVFAPDRLSSVAYYFSLNPRIWSYPTVQPTKVENRKGLLTHPAWLIAHAQNTETDPVKRGKWIREKLLAGTVPDVPITVEAVVPEDHTRTLRQRLASATENEYCWQCHKVMNPLGYAFESYDDFGRFRTQEELEHPDNIVKADKVDAVRGNRAHYKTLPVNAKSSLEGTGDAKLDGEVKDALDLIDRLARSKRVRQSIIRHAFRYFLGRNETLSDSKTLIDADNAYVESGGSFDAMIISLLTSDSFVYRKASQEKSVAVVKQGEK